MRTVEANASYTATPEQVWKLIGSPARWEEWLSIHKSWKGDPPAEAAEWLSATASASVMNMPITIDWTFEKVDAPHTLMMSGITRAKVKLTLTIALTATESGTDVTVVAAVDGGMIDGPMGAVFKNSLTGAFTKSLTKLGELAS
jgi:uncharacterized protein YndB with AHSA1/START domain